MGTVLQTHVAVPETAVLQSVANLDKLVAVIECQQPEADLYRYHSISKYFEIKSKWSVQYEEC